VRTLVRQLEERLAAPMRQAVNGALDRASRTNNPKRMADVDWTRTIRANLKHYQPEHRTIVPNLDDPVEILFGVQLGGGTDIAGALTYCESQVTNPSDSILI
jgi:hypothetical protein